VSAFSVDGGGGIDEVGGSTFETTEGAGDFVVRFGDGGTGLKSNSAVNSGVVVEVAVFSAGVVVFVASSGTGSTTTGCDSCTRGGFTIVESFWGTFSAEEDMVGGASAGADAAGAGAAASLVDFCDDVVLAGLFN